jgi:hypothetical protein
MGLLDWARAQKLRMDGWSVGDDSELPPALVKLWKAAVLALPATTTGFEVEDVVRLWCPDGWYLSGGSLGFDMFTLTPVDYDEDLWEGADLPPDLRRAYVLGYRAGGTGSGSGQDDEMGHDLLRGLARRLGGRWRRDVDAAWDDPAGEPVDPWVYSPVALPAEEALDLLAPHLVDASIVDREETGEYRIDADGLILWCDPLTPTQYPRVLAQSWYDVGREFAEYQFVSDPDAGGPERAEAAARVLADATGGVVLDEDGFPWR